jgi:ketosteroid isomerase-like protein
LKIRTVAMAMVGSLALTMPAMAGPLENARAQEQSFDSAILACTSDEAAELYEENAVAIYPGEGDIGIGRVGITKLLKSFSAAFCPNDQKKAALKDIRLAATPMGPDYVMIMRLIDATDKAGNHALLRSTKVIHQTDGKWRFLSDHTSVGLAAAAEGSEKPAP